MKILLSNDDGYHASGIQALIVELEKNHDIYVAAPAINHSAGSSALSVRKDIKIDNVKKNHYVINGTPADCVHIALTCLIDEDIDIVVSGINLGANLGDDVIYSGTVAAALEGRHLKMSPIAISLTSLENIDINEAEILSSDLIENIILNKQISKNTLLNINIPDITLKKYKSVLEIAEYTRLGKRGLPLPATQISNKNLYKIGAAGIPVDKGAGTDFFAINNGKVSITPVLYDLTDMNLLDKIKN
jgi:5'-nucleotidase